MKNNNLTNVSGSRVLSPEEMTGVKGGIWLAFLLGCPDKEERKPPPSTCANDAGTGYEWKNGEVVKCGS